MSTPAHEIHDVLVRELSAVGAATFRELHSCLPDVDRARVWSVLKTLTRRGVVRRDSVRAQGTRDVVVWRWNT